MAQTAKNLPASVGDPGSIPGSGRSPGGGNSSILAGESHGQRSLAGYSPWSHKELDVTQRLTHNNKGLKTGAASCGGLDPPHPLSDCHLVSAFSGACWTEPHSSHMLCTVYFIR